jgi:hypothetical protein
MQQLDEEEIRATARQVPKLLRQSASASAQARDSAADAADSLNAVSQTLGGPRPLRSAVAADVPPPPPPPQDVEVRQIPGYDTTSRFQPNPPASPAFYDEYGRPRPAFHGLDLGIVKLGYNDGGSLEAGVNVGIAKVGVQGGAWNGVNAEFMPYGGPLHARANAGVGVNRQDGFVARTGAGANFFNAVNGDADGETHIGPRGIGVDGDLRGRVLPVDAQFDAGGNVGPKGADAYTGGDVSLMHKAGVRSGGDFSLGENTRASAGVGLEAGNKSIDLGSHIETRGNTTFQPKLIDVQTGDSREETFYSTGNRVRDTTPPGSYE